MRHARVGLVLVLGVGAAVRLWGITFGWPYALHPDEGAYMPNALRMAAEADLNPLRFHNSHLFTYVCLLEVGITYAGARLLGIFAGPDDFAAFVRSQPAFFLVMARATSALFGTGSLYLTYAVGREVAGATTGLLASLVLCFSFLHARDSHFATNDVAMVFFVLLASRAGMRLFRRGRTRDLLWASLWAGLAVGTKYSAGLVLVVPVAALAACTASPASARPDARRRLGLVALGLTVAGAVFVATNPYSILEFGRFAADVSAQVAYGRHAWRGQGLEPVPLLMLTTLLEGMGSLPVALALAGWILLAVRKPGTAFVLSSFPLAYLAFMGTQRLFFARFLLPALPFLAVTSGYALRCLRVMAVRRWLRSPGAPPRSISAAAFVTALILLPSAARTLQVDRLLTRRDTRAELRDWLAAHVSAPTAVLADHPSSAALAQSLRPGPIRLRRVGWEELAGWTLPRLRSEGIRLVVASGFYRDSEERESVLSFYRALDREAATLKVFSPFCPGEARPIRSDDVYAPFHAVFSWCRPGPSIFVYEVPEKGGGS